MVANWWHRTSPDCFPGDPNIWHGGSAIKCKSAGFQADNKIRRSLVVVVSKNGVGAWKRRWVHGKWGRSDKYNICIWIYNIYLYFYVYLYSYLYWYLYLFIYIYICIYIYIFGAVIVPQLCKLQLFILSTYHSHCHKLFFTKQQNWGKIKHCPNHAKSRNIMHIGTSHTGQKYSYVVEFFIIHCWYHP